MLETVFIQVKTALDPIDLHCIFFFFSNI